MPRAFVLARRVGRRRGRAAAGLRERRCRKAAGRGSRLPSGSQEPGADEADGRLRKDKRPAGRKPTCIHPGIRACAGWPPAWGRGRRGLHVQRFGDLQQLARDVEPVPQETVAQNTMAAAVAQSRAGWRLSGTPGNIHQTPSTGPKSARRESSLGTRLSRLGVVIKEQQNLELGGDWTKRQSSS